MKKEVKKKVVDLDKYLKEAVPEIEIYKKRVNDHEEVIEQIRYITNLSQSRGYNLKVLGSKYSKYVRNVFVINDIPFYIVGEYVGFGDSKISLLGSITSDFYITEYSAIYFGLRTQYFYKPAGFEKFIIKNFNYITPDGDENELVISTHHFRELVF